MGVRERGGGSERGAYFVRGSWGWESVRRVNAGGWGWGSASQATRLKNGEVAGDFGWGFGRECPCGATAARGVG